MIKVIILDFDGVVIESVDIKTKAFGEMFKDQPEIARQFLDYHLKNNGKSRFDKFDWLYRNVLRQPLPEEERKRLGEKFSRLIFDNILKCPYVEGAIDFLKKYHGAFSIYVASITPQTELDDIIEKRSLKGYFKGVVGTTGRKTDIINEILRIEAADPQQVLFVGDTMEDYIASQETKVRFIARLKQEKFDNINVPKINDLREMAQYLKDEI